jgi:hypothetical protein
MQNNPAKRDSFALESLLKNRKKTKKFQNQTERKATMNGAMIQRTRA